MELERDYFDQLVSETRSSIKVQRSEFIAVAFPADDESSFQSELEKLRKETFDATHHCWAYRLIENGSIHARSSDAGEPSGTAGRPILQALEDADLLGSAVIVIRYFGGVKLGTGGLARAYRDAAREVLHDATHHRRYIYERIGCSPGFEKMNQVYRLIDPPNVLLAEERFEPEPRLILDVRSSMVDLVTSELEEHGIHSVPI